MAIRLALGFVSLKEIFLSDLENYVTEVNVNFIQLSTFDESLLQKAPAMDHLEQLECDCQSLTFFFSNLTKLFTRIYKKNL